MHPNQLDKYFDRWEKKLEEVTHINNPKIPISYVKKNGIDVLSEKDCKKYKKQSEKE